MTDFTVLVRDTTFTPLGTADAYTTLAVIPRFNAVGSWALTYPQGSLGAQLLTSGRGVQIFRKGDTTTPIITGPVSAITEAPGNDGVARLAFSGPCDNIALANRLAYPVPGAALSAQTSAYDIRTGVAETVMKAYTNVNAGPGAVVVRRTAGLTLEADSARGAAVAYSARFDVLLNLLQALAVSGGLGFQVRQSGTGLVFSVFVPADRSHTVVFSASTGSLGTYSYQLTGPTGTTAVVGDSGQLTGRVFTSSTNTTAESDWSTRVEVFVDSSSTTDAAQLAQAGQQALDAGDAQAQVTFTPVDTPQRSFGVDYRLGDTVTVAVGAGQITDVVREVSITDDATVSVKVTPTVGSSQAANPSTTPTNSKAVRALGVALGLLQRRR